MDVTKVIATFFASGSNPDPELVFFSRRQRFIL